MSALDDVLACPTCGSRLSTEGASRRCARCDQRYPSVGGLPVLLPDPAAVLLDWRASLDELAAHVDAEELSLLAVMSASAVVPDETRERVDVLRRGLVAQKAEVLACFAAAGLEPRARTAPPTPYGLAAGPLFYQHHIHRDWGWDDAEVLRAVAAMRRVLTPARPLGDVLFLGVGAGRVAAELARDASSVVGVDVNPLPMLVAARLLRGERVALHEVPSSPRAPRDAAVARVLAGREGLGPIDLLLADAFALPFADASFDTIVAEWFFDQCVPDVAAYLPQLARLLRPGGALLHHGPFVYASRAKRAHRYTETELMTLFGQLGFVVHAHETARLPFMESPICNQGRTERVLTFLATRTERPAAQAVVTATWQLDERLAVPLEVGRVEHAPHPFFAAVRALVDGARSTRDIASRLAREQGIDEGQMLVAVRVCLKELALRVASGAPRP